MKITILQEKLKEGIRIIERASSKSLTLPILKNAFIKAEKNFLSLTATDLEIGLTWWGLAKVEEPGIITTPISLLSGFLALLPNKPVALSSKDQVLAIECESYKTKIKGNNAEDFPIIPQVPETEFVVLRGKALCQGLSQTADVAASSAARPELSGVLFVVEKEHLKIVATDTFRLAEKILPLEKTSGDGKEHSVIVPQRTAREIINIFSEEEGDIKFFFGPSQILLESAMEETSHPQVHLTSRIIEGEYPNYQEVVPQKYETEIVLDRNELLAKVKAAGLFSGSMGEVSLKISPKESKLEIVGQNPDCGEFQSFLKGKGEGKEEEVSFKYKYLIDGLMNIKSAEVFFGLNGNSGPSVLKPVGDKGYLYVVMPLG